MNQPSSDKTVESEYSLLASRRQVLSAASKGLFAGLAGGALLPTGANARPTSESLSTTEILMKLMASTVNEAVPWYYSGRIYAVLAGATEPVPLFNFEGSEIYWVSVKGAQNWDIASSTLTFYRDLDDNSFLDDFKNPLTGKMNTVVPNVLRTRPGAGANYSDKGLAMFGQTLPLDSAPVNAQITNNGPVTWLQYTQTFSALPQPFLRSNSMMGPSSEVWDPEVTSVESQFAETTLSTWHHWLEMGAIQGHLVWHAVGRKLKNLDELPVDYHSRAREFSSVHFRNPNDE